MDDSDNSNSENRHGRSVKGRFSGIPQQPQKVLIESLLHAGRFEKAAAEAQKLLATDANNSAAWRLLHHARMGERRFDLALTAIEHAKQIKPQNRFYAKLHAICLKENGRFAEALPLLEELVQSKPDDVEILDALKVTHYRLGDLEQAIGAGEARLELLALRHSPTDPMEAFPPKDRNGPKIVAFSLWGRSPIYAFGAMVNARLVRLLMPGWRARFYVGQDVAAGVISDLELTGAEIVPESSIPTEIPNYMWRFLVMDDPAPSIFVCRDCDSRISEKEVAAVGEWLDSSCAFHVMRDHIFHNSLVLAGLWGGIAIPGISVRDRIAQFQERVAGDIRYGGDQAFLAQEIWPLIRTSVLVHDSYYSVGDARPFPIGGKGDDEFHVGAGIVSEKRLKEEAQAFDIAWPPGET